MHIFRLLLDFNNGRLRGKFKGSKGLRQGGSSLSFFLFTSVADGLTRLIDRATEAGFLRVVRWGGITW